MADGVHTDIHALARDIAGVGRHHDFVRIAFGRSSLIDAVGIAVVADADCDIANFQFAQHQRIAQGERADGTAHPVEDGYLARLPVEIPAMIIGNDATTGGSHQRFGPVKAESRVDGHAADFDNRADKAASHAHQRKDEFTILRGRRSHLQNHTLLREVSGCDDTVCTFDNLRFAEGGPTAEGATLHMIADRVGPERQFGAANDEDEANHAWLQFQPLGSVGIYGNGRNGIGRDKKADCLLVDGDFHGLPGIGDQFHVLKINPLCMGASRQENRGSSYNKSEHGFEIPCCLGMPAIGPIGDERRMYPRLAQQSSLPHPPLICSRSRRYDSQENSTEGGSMEIAGFAGALVGRDDTTFDTERFGWNGMIDRRPAVIAKCETAEDVAAAVRHAAANGLTAVARGGGHSVSGVSLPENGIMVDLGPMNSVTVDAERKIAHVGGGALLGDLDAATQAHGLAVTAGVEPSTGAGGLTLGGGIGFLCRKLGLTIDSLLGAQMVLADGSIVEVSEDLHPDLFWAIRGGGGQFGIVTRFDLALYDIGPDVVVSQAWYPLEKAHEVMRFLKTAMTAASDDLGLVPAILKVPPVEPFPAESHGQLAIAMVGCHTGEEAQARADLQPTLELGGMIFGFVDTQPYLEFQKTFADASPKGGRYYWKSIFVEDLSDELTDVLIEGARSIPGEYTQIFMEALGGAVGRVGATETAFSNRSARWNLGISTGWVDPGMDEAAISATRSWAAKLKKFSDGTVYLNYLDRDEIDRAKEGFGPNYERLAAIKAKYDPDNVFGGPLGGAG